MPAPNRLPELVVTVCENGYIIHRYSGGFTPGVQSDKHYVATSFAGLTRAIKLIATEARLCGNQSLT